MTHIIENFYKLFIKKYTIAIESFTYIQYIIVCILLVYNLNAYMLYSYIISIALKFIIFN